MRLHQTFYRCILDLKKKTAPETFSSAWKLNLSDDYS